MPERLDAIRGAGSPAEQWRQIPAAGLVGMQVRFLPRRHLPPLAPVMALPRIEPADQAQGQNRHDGGTQDLLGEPGVRARNVIGWVTSLLTYR